MCESDCGPGFWCISLESIMVKNSTMRLLKNNDIVHVWYVNLTLV